MIKIVSAKLGSARLGGALVAVCALALASAQAADAPKPDADSPELAKYSRTGQYETCLTNHQIRNIRILNRKQILFEMNGPESYLAEPEHCPGLSKSLALAYDATIDRLCNTTIIHLLDTSSPVPQRGTCGIERFEKLAKKPG
jgi:hypothetical protein